MKYTVGKVDDFEEGQKKRVMAGEKSLMLALVEGRFFAVEDTCSHARASLTAGKLSGYSINVPGTGRFLILEPAR